MRIQELIIKNFGKFSDKTIPLRDGVNLIYGENESGKTTLHTFIGSMLYGMERGRGRAAATDTFSRYEPWENPNYYAGAVRFVCGDRTFYLQRNFDKYGKSASLICEDDGEELSLEDGDLAALLDGMQKSLYESTVSIGQSETKTKEALSIELRNHATNFYATGDEELQLDGAFQYLKEKKRELDREEREQELARQEKRDAVENEASYVWRDLHKLQQELDEAEDKLDRAAEERKRNQKQREFFQKRIQEEERQEKACPKKWRVHPAALIAMLLLLIFAIVMLEPPWNYLWAIVIFLASSLYVWNKMKDGRRVQSEPAEENGSEEETEEEYFDRTEERLRWEADRIREEYRDKEIRYENLKEQLEELNEFETGCETLRKKREALQIAEKRLRDLSDQMQKEIGYRLNKRISEIIQELTDGRYEKLLADDEMKLFLLKDGRKITLDQVSKGTAEQIYFALRMASSEILYEEKFPIILDDAFAYYDDTRLARILEWLSGQDCQIILFTCQKREAELLEDLGIEYHYVNLSE